MVEVRHLMAKEVEVGLKHVGHPVPTRPHVEVESIFEPAPGPPSGLIVLFQDGHLVTGLTEQRGHREPRKT